MYIVFLFTKWETEIQMHIDKLSVDETGLTQLVELLGRDCLPNQFVREFVKNSDEAIQRVAASKKEQTYEGKILVDADWKIVESHNQFKMTFVDNGDGMTEDEMIKHLNNLSSSGHQNVYKNYGMGAKIASLTRNHAGIIYKSWKNGIGHRIIMRHDSAERIYGIVPIDTTDGRKAWCVKIDDSEKPEIIQEHGTQVTILGMNFEESDTMNAPTSSTRGGRENWLYQFLNTRFYTVAENVSLKVRVGYWRDQLNKKHNYLRRVLGQRDTLDKHSIAQGTLTLSDAKIYWRLMNPERGQGHGREYISGHTACINEEELFDLCDGRSNRAPEFGIYIGKEDVVLIVEPNANYVQNTARTGLVRRDGSELPWNRWADEFRAKMPIEIEEFIKYRLAKINHEDNSDTIQEKLKTVANLYKLSRYRSNSLGKFSADPDSDVASKTGKGSSQTSNNGSGKRSTKGNYSGAFEELLLSGLKENGVAADVVQPDKFPELIWTDTSDSPELEDRAARYHDKDNKIMANTEFQGYLDVKEHFIKMYPDAENCEAIIAPIVKGVFAQQLIETIMGARSFQNRPKWNPTDFDNAVSPEALSSAVMSRYHIINQMKRDIHTQLGKPPAV